MLAAIDKPEKYQFNPSYDVLFNSLSTCLKVIGAYVNNIGERPLFNDIVLGTSSREGLQQ